MPKYSNEWVKNKIKFKYLEVILEDDLYWESNLSKLEKKLSYAIWLSSKVRHYVSKYLLFITLCLT